MRHGGFRTRTGETDGETLSILRNNGDGEFSLPELLTVGNAPNGLVVTDLDGKGGLDLATPNFDDDDVSILLNQTVEDSF